MNKFCKNCGIESDRYADGRCKTCTLARSARWAAENRDRVNANSRAWNRRNSESKRALNAAYRLEQQTQINQKRKNQREIDPSLERVKAARRRALKRVNGGVLSKDIVQQLLTKQNNICACCGITFMGKFHLDHIIPLSLGGQNSDANTQLLLPKCNLQKYNTPPESFLSRRQKEMLHSKL